MNSQRNVTKYTCDGCGATVEIINSTACPSGWFVVVLQIRTGVYQGATLNIDACSWECAMAGATQQLANWTVRS